MTYTLDITAPGWSLANARQCALAAAAAYNVQPLPCIISPVDGTQIVITDCGNCILLAVEGSKNIRQFLTDGEAWKRNLGDCMIHAGFYALAASVINPITAALRALPHRPIFVTGHSLGGAIAKIIAYRLTALVDIGEVHSVYTFGCPRLVSETGVNLYKFLAERTYSVTNGADIVPWSPSYYLGYRNVGTEYHLPYDGGIISGPALWPTLLINAVEIYREWRRGQFALLTDHFIQSYLNRLAAL